jgi:hypothetical protein
MAKNQLQTTEKGNTLPAGTELASMFAQDANLGLENLSKQDMATPFLNVVQSLSPQRIKSSDKYITGAEEGMIFNSVTQELFEGKDGVLFIPVYYEMVYNVWVDRKKGQGFKGTFKTRQEADARAAEDPTWQVVDTQNHYVIFFSPTKKSWSGAVISCTSTKLKVSREFNTKLSELRVPSPDGKGVLTPPRFATIWKMTTVEAKKDQHTFYNVKFSAADGSAVTYINDPSVYVAAKKFYGDCSEQKVTLDYQAAEEPSPSYSNAEEILDAEIVDDEPKF